MLKIDFDILLVKLFSFLKSVIAYYISFFYLTKEYRKKYFDFISSMKKKYKYIDFDIRYVVLSYVVALNSHNGGFDYCDKMEQIEGIEDEIHDARLLISDIKDIYKIIPKSSMKSDVLNQFLFCYKSIYILQKAKIYFS